MDTNPSTPSSSIDILDFSKKELTEFVASLGEKPFRAKQIWKWVYCKGIYDFAKMTDIAKAAREKIAQECTVGSFVDHVTQTSKDDTIKFLFKLSDGNGVESVYIPDAKRKTICVSSQVGCALKCSFCHTGTQGFTRNLTTSEIVQQVMFVRDYVMGTAENWLFRAISSSDLACTPQIPQCMLRGSASNFLELSPKNLNSQQSQREQQAEKEKDTFNIVFMGMGEPFYNYDNVAKAIEILLDGDGLAISRRKITISTSGVVPFIKKCAEELRVGLAISLHATRNELRDKLMPINRKYPIKELIDACRSYQRIAHSKRITFEYLMLDGVNDSIEDAKELVRLIRGIPCIVNLLPFNKWPGSKYECSGLEVMEDFARIIKKAGYQATIRTPRGRDILAACGQLKGSLPS